MAETWEISQLLADPKIIQINRKVIITRTYHREYAIRPRTHQQLLDLAQDGIEGLEIQLEQNRRLASIVSRIKGQGAEWEYELEYRRQSRLILEIDRELEERCLFAALFPDSYFDDEWVIRFKELMHGCDVDIRTNILRNAKFINDSGELPAVLNDEDPSFTDQRISQPQDPQQVGVPSLMASYHTMKDDDTKREALRAIEALETLFCKAKAEVHCSLSFLEIKEMEESPKEVLRTTVGDLFDYDNDMRLLRRYVDRLQYLKPCMTDRVLRQRVITEFEAGKFDRATTRFALRLKYQLSSLERIADHARACSVHPRLEDIQEEDIQE